tara:strand:+ start:247 stop:528 length:282 start_codon:yes stop_codon:yes gene_type:complete
LKKQKIKVKRSRSKKGDDKPINVSTMGDDTAPDSSSSPSEIHVGGNHLYYEEKKEKNKKKREILKGMDLLKKRISYADFRQKSNEVRYGRNSI